MRAQIQHIVPSTPSNAHLQLPGAALLFGASAKGMYYLGTAVALAP